jgi:hypothetical protein
MAFPSGFLSAIASWFGLVPSGINVYEVEVGNELENIDSTGDFNSRDQYSRFFLRDFSAKNPDIRSLGQPTAL